MVFIYVPSNIKKKVFLPTLKFSQHNNKIKAQGAKLKANS